MRRLATIQKIEDIKPIELADNIVMALILGWQCVVKKDEFNIGDEVVYIECDSVLPDKPEFAFLKSKRIKTIKLRGQISQGLVLPKSILGEGTFTLDEDVTNLLGIEKYELPSWDLKRYSQTFPAFINKTDEPRIQNIPYILDKYTDLDFTVTEKIDGSSITFYNYNGVNGVCSRNNIIPQGNSQWWYVPNKLDLFNKMEELGLKNIAIQGELIGEGIQGNRYNIKKFDVYAFNAFNIENQYYYTPEDAINLFNLLGLNSVPVLFDKFTLPSTVQECVELSKGQSILNPKIKREGLVIRPKHISKVIDRGLANNRLSFKVINPEWLLKYE